MILGDELRDLILKRCSTHQLREAAINQGMKTLREDALTKILCGSTTLEECLRVIYSG